MSGSVRLPLVEVMAKAGYDAMMARTVEERHRIADLVAWETQTQALRDDWISTARAMFDAWQAHIKGKSLP